MKCHHIYQELYSLWVIRAVVGTNLQRHIHLQLERNHFLTPRRKFFRLWINKIIKGGSWGGELDSSHFF